jgi:hypothetical protein
MINENHYKELFEQLQECQASNRPCVLVYDELSYDDDNIEYSRISAKSATHSAFEARGMMESAYIEFRQVQNVWIAGSNVKDEEI